ncbi:hypothetical protein FHI69_21500 [Janthinobacterium lividum]|uniref:Uncharacterized protein n=1 Tax=Janthinobacterium lividum TaxID=29581 RepID=A0A5C4NI21_9BURK|nr:hypothetical protein [Janthinobacterium lividum]TNC74421.1 hypothetical protein FHI69_21500 [Janthinobacterium lividum]
MGTVLLPPHYEGSASIVRSTQSYTEAMLQTAWRSKTNQDTAASIVCVFTRCWGGKLEQVLQTFGGSAATEGGLIAST